MSAGREQILAALRRALKPQASEADRRATVQARLENPPRGPQPQRAQRPRSDQIVLFTEMAQEVSATVERLGAADAVPRAIVDYLKRENLPAALRIAPDPVLEALPWQDQPLLRVAAGRAEPADEVSVTHAFCGIAETGTLMLRSGAAGPTTLNFLPDNNIVVIAADDVVGRYEEAWERLRAVQGVGEMPRTVNLITGPSRTADIEQTIQLGAHGPRRLHILIVDSNDAS